MGIAETIVLNKLKKLPTTKSIERYNIVSAQATAFLNRFVWKWLQEYFLTIMMLLKSVHFGTTSDVSKISHGITVSACLRVWAWTVLETSSGKIYEVYDYAQNIFLDLFVRQIFTLYAEKKLQSKAKSRVENNFL